MDLFASENDLDELQNTEFKRTIMNFIKGFKYKFKKDTKKQDSEFKEKEHKENKFLSDVLENTDVKLMGTTKQSSKYRHKTAGNNKTIQKI